MAFELVKKTKWLFNEKRGKWQRKRAPEKERTLPAHPFRVCAKPAQVPLRFERHVVCRIGEYELHQGRTTKEDFIIMPIKANRKVALPLENKKRGSSTSELRL